MCQHPVISISWWGVSVILLIYIIILLMTERLFHETADSRLSWRWLFIRTLTHTHTRTHARTHTHTHTYIHTYIHTHSFNDSLNSYWWSHIDLSISVPVVTPTAHAIGGTLINGISDPTSCFVRCVDPCVAVDFDSSTMTCWHHTSATCRNLEIKAQCVHLERPGKCPWPYPKDRDAFCQTTIPECFNRGN